MYSIQRKNRIKEELALLGNEGEILHVLAVDINVDEFIGRWNKACVALDKAQNAVKEDPANAEEFGKACIAMLVLVFGEEQTDILLKHYENNYSELLLDVYPFIAEIITPKLNEASEARKEQLLAAAKIAKKRG